MVIFHSYVKLPEGSFWEPWTMIFWLDRTRKTNFGSQESAMRWNSISPGKPGYLRPCQTHCFPYTYDNIVCRCFAKAGFLALWLNAWFYVEGLDLSFCSDVLVFPIFWHEESTPLFVQAWVVKSSFRSLQ